MSKARVGFLLLAALLLLTPLASADPTTGMVYMVVTSGGPFAPYSTGGAPQAITIAAIAQIIGGPPEDLQVVQFTNMEIAAPPGSEYFIFGSVPQPGITEFGLGSPPEVVPQPLPTAWETGIVPGLENMQNLDPALFAGGAVVGTTTTALWSHLAAHQAFGFDDEDFAEITNFRALAGDVAFMSYDPLNTIVFGTNEDAFTSFTPPTGAGQFTNNFFGLFDGPTLGDGIKTQFPTSGVLNPFNFPGLPNAPGDYLTQLELPEASSLVLLAGALAGLGLRRRRRSAA